VRERHGCGGPSCGMECGFNAIIFGWSNTGHSNQFSNCPTPHHTNEETIDRGIVSQKALPRVHCRDMLVRWYKGSGCVSAPVEWIYQLGNANHL